MKYKVGDKVILKGAFIGGAKATVLSYNPLTGYHVRTDSRTFGRDDFHLRKNRMKREGAL